MDNSPTSPDFAAMLANLSTKLNTVLSLLLGFLAYSFLSCLAFDYHLFISLFKKKPSLFVVLNRLAYFMSKCVLLLPVYTYIRLSQSELCTRTLIPSDTSAHRTLSFPFCSFVRRKVFESQRFCRSRCWYSSFLQKNPTMSTAQRPHAIINSHSTRRLSLITGSLHLEC